MVWPWYSNCITELVTEMPRCFSTSIQSEVAWRADLRAFTVPASWIAPPNSSSFSVSVVLPAPGWDMIAKVRRFSASRGSSGGKGVEDKGSRPGWVNEGGTPGWHGGRTREFYQVPGRTGFLATWRVLSNVLCTLLIFSARPRRVHEHVRLFRQRIARLWLS